MAPDRAPALGSTVGARRVQDGALPPLRIAFAIDSLLGTGGTEMNAVRVAEALVARGHAVELYTLRAEGSMGVRYAAAGIPVHEARVHSLVAPGTLWQMRALASRLRAGRFDVVHTHDLYTNVVVGGAARWAGVPAVVASKRWMHWRPAHRLLNRAAFRVVHAVLGNSDRVGASLREEDGVPAARVTVVPNFVEDAAFESWPADVRAARRAALGIPPDAPVIGIVARLREEKDHPTLLRAAAALRGRHPGLRVVLVGDGPDQEALVRLTGELGIGDAVIFAGHQPNRPNPHQLLDISVLCSRHEGFPNTIVEAMAAEVPVVATAVGGVVDAVSDGVTGLLVPPGDVDALAHAIDRLLDDPALRSRMGAAGRVAAQEQFHETVVMARLDALYRRLLARRLA